MEEKQDTSICAEPGQILTHIGTIGRSLPTYFGSFLCVCVLAGGQDPAALPPRQRGSGLPFKVVHAFALVLVESRLHM